ncbi:MAG: hypothetical protein AAEJ47_01785, partial [Planctomycetota bacterium]
ALRWSTMYNFYFTCNAPPELNTATLGLFKPVAGEPDSVSISVLAPSGDFLPGVSDLTCTQVGELVDLGWTNGEVYDTVEVSRDGTVVETIAGSSTSWTDTSPTPGAHTYAVNGTQAGVPSGPVTCSVTVTAALDIAVPGGDPTIFDPFGGETFDVTITPVAGSSVQAGTESLMLDVGAGVETISLNFLGGVNYEMTFPPIACGSEFVWWIEAQSASGQFVSYPESGPAPGLSAFGVNTDDTDFEQSAGWTVGSPNDATTGTWERGDPLGTNAQPGDDHTAAGTQCWFTGQGTAGGSNGQNDVDNGSTTLYSAVMDMSGASNPQISYFRWYSNETGGSNNADIFEIEISDDASSWVNVETIGPAGAGTSGGWIEHSFLVSDFVLLSSSVQVRFIASDLGGGSIIEAAIDDFSVEDVDCSVPDCNTNGIPDADDIANGTSLDCDIDGIPDDCSTSDGTVPDCNANGIPDICDVAAGADDCDLDGQLDICQINDDPSSDCDTSGTLDLCDIAEGTADDCNTNAIPDSCDIANGTSTDNNGDGEPDECFVQDWVRGDVNADGMHDISDAVSSLEYLFGGGGVACEASADANNDDQIDIADAIFLLSYLFSGGLVPEDPFPACGQDPAGSVLDCASFTTCP